MNEGLNRNTLTPDDSGVEPIDLEETKRMIEAGSRRFWATRGGEREKPMSFKQRTYSEVEERKANKKQ